MLLSCEALQAVFSQRFPFPERYMDKGASKSALRGGSSDENTGNLALPFVAFRFSGRHCPGGKEDAGLLQPGRRETLPRGAGLRFRVGGILSAHTDPLGSAAHPGLPMVDALYLLQRAEKAAFQAESAARQKALARLPREGFWAG